MLIHILISQVTKPDHDLTLSALGGGGQIDPHFFLAFITAKRLGQSGWNFLTFPAYPLTKDLTKKIWIFLGGVPPFGPSEGEAAKNDPQSLPMTQFFFMQNLFILQKWGC